jgi:HAD superfamily hydrolase (TIGR01490 family)
MSPNKTALTIFDLDWTLIRKNSSYQFCKYLYRRKVYSHSHMAISLFYRLQFHLFNMSLEELHEKVFRKLLFGFHLPDMVKHVGMFVSEFLPKEINPSAYAALKRAQQLGHQTVILSNSPSFLVGPIADFFGVDEWQATQYSVDKDRTLCNIADLMEGTRKAQYLREARKRLDIPRENVTVYTDSHHDLPLLLEAGNAVVVNPDKKLLKIAKQNRWSMI